MTEFADVSHSTVKHVFRLSKKTQSTSNLHENCGRKKIITYRHRQRFSNRVLTNQSEYKAEIAKKHHCWVMDTKNYAERNS